MNKKFLMLATIITYSLLRAQSTQEIFTNIYEQGQWRIDETFSGQGSRLVETTIIRTQLPELLKELGIQTLLDAGCGDFNWLRVTELPVQNYIGTDIVPSLIENNTKKYASAHRQFLCLNIAADSLPHADAILCRDVLNHLPHHDVARALYNFKQSGAKYLIATLQVSCSQNNDIAHAGPWRALNLTLPPFSLPQPEYLVLEGNFEQSTGKSLAVWQLSNLNF